MDVFPRYKYFLQLQSFTDDAISTILFDSTENQDNCNTESDDEGEKITFEQGLAMGNKYQHFL